LPRQSAELDLLVGEDLQHAVADQVLTGNFCIAGAGRGHVTAVMFAGQAGIVEVNAQRLLVIAMQGPAAFAGRIAGTADARQPLSSFRFTHGDPFTGDSPVVQPFS
jgi:hypothetical protein